MNTNIISKIVETPYGKWWIERRTVPKGERGFTVKAHPKTGKLLITPTKRFDADRLAYVMVFVSSTGNSHTTAFRSYDLAIKWLLSLWEQDGNVLSTTA